MSTCFVAGAAAALPGANGRIVYTVDVTCGSNCASGTLETVLPTGKRRVVLLGEGPFGGPTEPAFSPRGRVLLFTNGDRIYRVRFARRPRPRELTEPTAPLTTSFYDSSPDWSPDGRDVVFARLSEASEIRILRRGASTSRPLTAGRDPAWSATGLIAFTREEGAGLAVYTIRTDGAQLRRVVFGHSPDWSPDGRRIVFVTPRGHIATIGPNGQGLHLVTRSSRHKDGSPAFSPRGRRITFVRDQTELYVTARNGNRPRRILTAPCLAEYDEEDCSLSSPDWQPLPPRSR